MYSLTVCNLFSIFFASLLFIHVSRTKNFSPTFTSVSSGEMRNAFFWCVYVFVCLCIVFGECCGAVECNRKFISIVNSTHSQQYSFCVPNKTAHIQCGLEPFFSFALDLFHFNAHSVIHFASFKQLMAYFSFGWWHRQHNELGFRKTVVVCWIAIAFHITNVHMILFSLSLISHATIYMRPRFCWTFSRTFYFPKKNFKLFPNPNHRFFSFNLLFFVSKHSNGLFFPFCYIC